MSAPNLSLTRSLERWANCKPSAIRDGSPAQMFHFAEDAQKDIAALAARVAELEMALVSPYCGLLVLKTMLRKAKLDTGVYVTEQALADLVALHPALPVLSALRTASVLKGAHHD